VHPPVISHFHGEALVEEFGWQGTRDLTPWLAAPRAIEWLAAAGGRDGWTAVRAANDGLAAEAADLLADAWGTGTSAPASMRGSMATVEIPASLAALEHEPEAVRDRLASEHRIEVPVLDVGGRRWVRISAQLYNRRAQYERLASVVARGL
jgi:isopenicillin-N epimerase